MGEALVTTAPDPWITPAAGAAQIDVHEATVRRAIKRGDLRAVRIGAGRIYRLRQSWLDAWLDRGAA